VAHCRVGLAELDVRAGRTASAREHLTAAARLFGDMGIAAGKKRVERQLNELPA
jgi:hypothetical protein